MRWVNFTRMVLASTACPENKRVPSYWIVSRELSDTASAKFRSALATIGLTIVGVVYGASTARGRLDRAIRERAERMRIELYTINQLLAMHVRTGAGPMQAVQRVVDRGVRIPDNLIVGEDPVEDERRFRRTEKGICLITQAMLDKLA